LNTTTAWKVIPTSTAGTAIGSSTQPVFIDSNGDIQTCTKYSEASVSTADFAKLLKPIATTTTASASTWNIPSGSKQVWGEKFSDSTLTYTPEGGSATPITNTGDWVIWLTPSATSNSATLNMRIDGTYYGSLSGNASTATKFSSARTIKLTGDTTGSTSADGSSGWSIATTTKRLSANNELTYGNSNAWNGINYFNHSSYPSTTVKTNDAPTGTSNSKVWWHILRCNHNNNAGYYTDLAIPFNANSLYYKRINNGSIQNTSTNSSGWIQVLD